MRKNEKQAIVSFLFLITGILAYFYMPLEEESKKNTPIYLNPYVIILYFSISFYFSLRATLFRR